MIYILWHFLGLWEYVEQENVFYNNEKIRVRFFIMKKLDLHRMDMASLKIIREIYGHLASLEFFCIFIVFLQTQVLISVLKITEPLLWLRKPSQLNGN